VSEVDRIVDQLDRALDGPAWHGPSIMRALHGVGATEAAARPVADRHSIWELVGHLSAWTREVIGRLEGRRPRDLPPDENFPAAAEVDEAHWRRAVADLRAAHGELRRLVEDLPPERLDEALPDPDGEPWTVYATLHGLIQHDLYHAGQIALLRRG
jgi:uncharacterized damage-inducible protein DinB